MTRCPNCDELMDLDRDCFSCPHKRRGVACDCPACRVKRGESEPLSPSNTDERDPI